MSGRRTWVVRLESGKNALGLTADNEEDALNLARRFREDPRSRPPIGARMQLVDPDEQVRETWLRGFDHKWRKVL